MTRQDSARREVVLALLASRKPLSSMELMASTGRGLEDVRGAILFLLGVDLIYETVLGSEQEDTTRFELDDAVLAVLKVVGRGSSPLDRHVAEALALRERSG